MSGMPVRTPCPISERWQTMVTVPSGAIETKARGLFTVPCGMPSAPHLGASSASAERDGRTCTASTSPPVATMPFKTPRRLTFSIPDVETISRICLVMSRSRSLLDGGANALIGPTAANVAVHRTIDVGVGGMRALFQKRRGLHDLASLAVAALRHVERPPSCLNGVIPLRVKALDGGDRLGVRVADRGHARSDGLAIEMHRAGAGGGHAAAELGASKPEDVAQIPEHRHRRIAVKGLRLPVHMQSDHLYLPVSTRSGAT